MQVTRCPWSSNLQVSKSSGASITLQPDQWVRLQNNITKLESLRETAEKIVISGCGNVKAGWHNYENNKYVNLRRYVDGSIPTAIGVTLTETEWAQVKFWLQDSLEMRIMKQAYAQTLREKAREYNKSSCEGCHIQHGSQHHHQCVMSTDSDSVARYVHKHGWHLKHALIVLEAARIALKKGFCLCRPRETLLFIEALYENDVVQSAGAEEDGLVIQTL